MHVFVNKKGSEVMAEYRPQKCQQCFQSSEAFRVLHGEDNTLFGKQFVFWFKLSLSDRI